MKKLIIAITLVLAQVTPVLASGDVEEKVPLKTFVSMVEKSAITCKAEGRGYSYTLETSQKFLKLVDITSMPFGERYDNLSRLVKIGKEFGLTDCLVHFVPDAILVSYIKTPNSDAAEVLAFLNLVMDRLVSTCPDMFCKARYWEVDEVVGYAYNQAKNKALTPHVRGQFAEFFKTHCLSERKMVAYHKLLAQIEAAKFDNKTSGKVDYLCMDVEAAESAL